MAPTSPPSPGAGSVAPAPSLGASQRFASPSVGPSGGGNAPMSPTHHGRSLDLWGQYPIMTPKQTFVPKKRWVSHVTVMWYDHVKLAKLKNSNLCISLERAYEWDWNLILSLSLLSFCHRTLSNAMSPLPAVHESESEGDGEFRPPAKPPTKHQWESDNSTKVCRVCRNVSFNMVGIIIMYVKDR